MNDLLSTQKVRNLLHDCGIPNASKACVAMFATPIEYGPEGVTYWEMKYLVDEICDVVQKILAASEKLRELQDTMKLSDMKKPTGDMAKEFRQEWTDGFRKFLAVL